MKTFVYSAALAAGIVGLCAFSYEANAATVSILSQDTVNLPSIPISNPAPFSQTGSFIQSQTGASLPGVYRSPFENFVTQAIPAAYLAVPYTSIGSNGFGSATYNFSGPKHELTLLWGSPDVYNVINFYSGTNGGGTLLASINGGALSIQTFGHDLVTLQLVGGSFQSVVLSSTNAAFEFTDLSASTPLPAAFLLFGTGLGVMGLVARRRKQSIAHSAIAAA